jgi:tetratricopeptide (TPR) repeat protein
MCCCRHIVCFNNCRVCFYFIFRSTEDIKKLDSDMALQQVAGALQGLQPEERLSWAIKWRENGNAQFAKGDYATAANTYLQCLTALEDMTNDSTKRQITLPVLCNLAACALVERRYSNSQELCTMALEQDANSIKVSRIFRQFPLEII